MSIKILITYKNEHQLLNSDILTPIQTGRSLADKHFKGMIGDDTGDNISHKNNLYGEVSAQYWAWKNYAELGNPDYIGFMHYRRHFIFNSKNYDTDDLSYVRFPQLNESYLNEIALNDETITKVVAGNDVLTTYKLDLTKLNFLKDTSCLPRDIFEHTPYLKRADYDLMITTLKQLHPDFIDALKYVDDNHDKHICNMFIMNKEVFFRYNEFLFSVLFAIEDKIDASMYGTDAGRILGYLAERIFTIFMAKIELENHLKIKYLNASFVENTASDAPLEPAFTENCATVVFSCSNEYVPYLSVALTSLAEHTNPQHNYDIIILHKNISQDNQEVLHNHFQQENISVRFLLINKDQDLLFAQKIREKTDIKYFPDEAIFRLFVHEQLPNHHKVVYLDVDLVLKRDIYELYNTDLNGYAIGACIDTTMTALYNGDLHNTRNYLEKNLELKRPYQYINSGVLLLDLVKMRADNPFSNKDLVIHNKQFTYLDQDLINYLLQDNISYLDFTWNYQIQNLTVKTLMHRYMPQPILLKYLEASKTPKIIHYAGEIKPWSSFDCLDIDNFTLWWTFARKSPFYENILYNLFKIKEDTNKRQMMKYKILGKIHFSQKKRRAYRRKYQELKIRMLKMA